MSVPVVEIGFRVPKGIRFEGTENIQESDYVYKRDLFAIRGMERIVRRYRLTAHRRGYYTATQLSCHAPSFLFREDYILDRRVQEDVPGLYVYAPWVECSELLRAVEVILGSRESARRVLEDPFAFASIRDYTPEDPMKTINWKASARTGRLMVNTFASTISSGVRIFLDVRMDPEMQYGEEQREDAVALAASLIRSLVRKNLDVSLAVNAFVPDALNEAESMRNSQQKEAGTEDGWNRQGREAETEDGRNRQGREAETEDGRNRQDGTAARGITLFPSAAGGDRMTAIEHFLAADFESADTVSFADMIAGRESGTIPSGYGTGNVVQVYITSSDSPAVRRAVHQSLGTRNSGILAYPVRGSEETGLVQEGNLCILPLRVRQKEHVPA